MTGQLAVWSNLSSLPHVHNSHFTRRRTTCALRRKIDPKCQSCQEFFLPLHCFAFFLPTGTLQLLHLVICCLSYITFSNSLVSAAVVLWRFREDFSAMCVALKILHHNTEFQLQLEREKSGTQQIQHYNLVFLILIWNTFLMLAWR